MGESKIEWTERTWNPIVGCSVLTPGCTNCYAMKMAARIEAMKRSHYDGTTQRVKGNAVWTGKIALAPDHILLEPLRRKKPTTYFVNSMGDLFHEDAPDEWIDKVFAIMACAPQHTFQVLTKRAARMREYCASHAGVWCPGLRGKPLLTDELIVDLGDGRRGPLPNVWLGVSAERQQEADERIRLLLQTPAAIRFVSAEPLLGPIDLTAVPLPFPVPGQIDWLIVGGESGVSARPMRPDWARSLRDQCAAVGVAFFFKQWGQFAPFDLTQPPINPRKFYVRGRGYDYQLIKGRPEQHAIAMVSLGKKGAGRNLDGKEHNAMPERVRG